MGSREHVWTSLEKTKSSAPTAIFFFCIHSLVLRNFSELFIFLLRSAFCLYLEHTSQKSIPPGGILFMFSLCTLSVVLSQLLSFVRNVQHTTKTYMPPASFFFSLYFICTYLSLFSWL